MAPAPGYIDAVLTLNPLSNDSIVNTLSSEDDFEEAYVLPNHTDTGLLAIDGADDVYVSDSEVNVSEAEPDDADTKREDEVLESIENPVNSSKIVCTAPSTPTGERDLPLGIRRSSVVLSSDQLTHQLDIPQMPKADNPKSQHEENNSLIDSVFGCLKPFFSAVNKFGESIRHHTDPNFNNIGFNKNDDWLIPIERIINDSCIIGSGNEGPVYRCTLDGRSVACKRVKTKEQTNIQHLRKLNHQNVIRFQGVSVSAPLFYIVMEYCPYGSLYDVLKKRREKSRFTKPTQVLDWSKQIANGVHYLHMNRIVHRDLKSPNILIAENNVLKISDFGTSKEISNRRSAPMSFNGTTGWMAPELIRSEPCSEKIDVWSFGVVLWELLTCTVPYQNIDPVAVMWGVGKGNLTLPIPSSAPEPFRLLMTMCWNQNPNNRPSFHHILKHLAIAEPQINIFQQEQEYAELTRAWASEIENQLSKLPPIDISATLKMTHDELLKKRTEELQHIQDIRVHYEMQARKVDDLYIDLMSIVMQLKKREQDIRKREQELKIEPRRSSIGFGGKKKTLKAIKEARENSIKLIKATNHALKNAKIMQGSYGEQAITKNNQDTAVRQSQPNPESIFNTATALRENPDNNTETAPAHESPSNKSNQRRKKTAGHRRTGSKGSVASWAPPTLSYIAEQEQIRASVEVTPNQTQINYSASPGPNEELNAANCANDPLPSISARVDSKSKGSMRGLNPKTLDLDFRHPTNSKSHGSITSVQVSLTRKLSSSDLEDHDPDKNKRSSTKSRRRRLVNSQNSRSVSPSSTASFTNKTSLFETNTLTAEDQPSNLEKSHGHETVADPRKIHRTVSFHHHPTIKSDRSPSFQMRRSFNQSNVYTSSEEGEVEELHSDHFILDDERRRAKHQDINRKVSGNFSSESEIYGEVNRRPRQSRNESALSDEGGHISDDRPASRESIINSELEEEFTH